MQLKIFGRAGQNRWMDNWNSSVWLKDLVGKTPVEAFHLEIDGQTLDSNWQWVNAYEVEDKPVVKHSVVELVSRGTSGKGQHPYENRRHRLYGAVAGGQEHRECAGCTKRCIL